MTWWGKMVVIFRISIGQLATNTTNGNQHKTKDVFIFKDLALRCISRCDRSEIFPLSGSSMSGSNFFSEWKRCWILHSHCVPWSVPGQPTSATEPKCTKPWFGQHSSSQSKIVFDQNFSVYPMFTPTPESDFRIELPLTKPTSGPEFLQSISLFLQHRFRAKKPSLP